jgi:hypothetical protein
VAHPGLLRVTPPRAARWVQVRKLFFAAPLSAAVPRTPLPTGGPRKLVALVSGLQVSGLRTSGEE